MMVKRKGRGIRGLTAVCVGYPTTLQ